MRRPSQGLPMQRINLATNTRNLVAIFMLESLIYRRQLLRREAAVVTLPRSSILLAPPQWGQRSACGSHTPPAVGAGGPCPPPCAVPEGNKSATSVAQQPWRCGHSLPEVAGKGGLGRFIGQKRKGEGLWEQRNDVEDISPHGRIKITTEREGPTGRGGRSGDSILRNTMRCRTACTPSRRVPSRGRILKRG